MNASSRELVPKVPQVGKGSFLIIMINPLERPVSFVHPLNILEGTGTLADTSSICDVKWSCTEVADIETSLARFVFSQAPLFSLSYALRLEVTGTLGV